MVRAASKKIPQPIALHLTSLKHLLAALRVDAADYYNLLGPLKEFTRLGKAYANGGMPGVARHGHGSGHPRHEQRSCGGGLPVANFPATLSATFSREDDLIVDPIRIEDGAAIVPARPGLGVELDREALERYRED